MIGNFPAVLNFNRFSQTQPSPFITNCRFSPIIDLHPHFTELEISESAQSRKGEQSGSTILPTHRRFDED